MNRQQFRQRLEQGPLLLDGAMGTVLHAKGFSFDLCFDHLNLSDPAAVAAIHQAYIAAGADVIETNSFGANRFRMGEYNLAGKVVEVNAAAVDIARRAVAGSFKSVLIAGSVGPLGARLAPLGRVSVSEAEAAFAEQIAALAAGGVDLLMIETMSDLVEIRAAVTAARQHAHDLPIVVMMTFGQDDRTLLGVDAAQAAVQLAALDVDMVGINCSSGPNQVLRLVATFRAALPDVAIAAVPNAGFPEQAGGGRLYYPATPAYFADYTRAFVEAGVTLIGGCCGTTAEHIAAMRDALDHPRPSPIPLPVINLVEQAQRVSVASEPPTALARALQRGDFVVTVEMRPPKGVAAQKMLASAAMLKQAGANLLDVADIPLARMRMSAWAAAYLIQREVGLETVLHFPTRGRNLLRVQADLLAAHALGVRNLFVTMGDPAQIGDYPDAMDSYDIVPTGLIQLIKEQFNVGLDKAGAQLDQPTSFVVGCAVSLNPRDARKEAALLAKKIRSGADFALTQPLFDPQGARDFIALYEAEYGPLPLPLIVGIQPLFNSRNAEFLHNEVPGIVIPDHYRARMAAAEDQPREGVLIAQELVAAARDIARGVYLIPAFGRYDLVADVIDSLRVAA